MDLGEVLQVIDDYADCLPSRPIKLAGSRIVVVVTAAMPTTCDSFGVWGIVNDDSLSSLLLLTVNMLAM